MTLKHASRQDFPALDRTMGRRRKVRLSFGLDCHSRRRDAYQPATRHAVHQLSRCTRIFSASIRRVAGSGRQAIPEAGERLVAAEHGQDVEDRRRGGTPRERRP